jgi:hypothetical protein
VSHENINSEATMAIQNTTSRTPKSQRLALLAFVPFLLCGDPLGEAAAHFSYLICALTGELLKFAPSIILAGCQALESCILAHQLLFLGVQTLLSSWQVLQCVFGAA